MDDALQIVKDTKIFYDKIDALHGRFDLSSPKGFQQAEDFIGISVEEFEAKIDIYDLSDKIDRAILKLGLDNNLISY